MIEALETRTLYDAAPVPLTRSSPANYAADSQPNDRGLPNARTISNLMDQPDIPLDGVRVSQRAKRNDSNVVWSLGQLVGHDIVFVVASGRDPSADVYNVIVPAGDRHFPAGTVIPLHRTPQPLSSRVTPLLDVGVLYGSDVSGRENWLREGRGGRLKVNRVNGADYLPVNDGSQRLDLQGPLDRPVVAGDDRVNESIMLTGWHTLLLREHNRRADQVKRSHAGWSDERVYREARRLTTATWQKLVFDWAKALLGSAAPGGYRGYDPRVNPAPRVEFATAAMRLGHDQTDWQLDIRGPQWFPKTAEIQLRHTFQRPHELERWGLDAFIRGQVFEAGQAIDGRVFNHLRNQPAGPGRAIDLAALDIQRGRDHGLPSYNQLRRDYGLAPLTSFSQFARAGDEIRRLYGGRIRDVDAVVGMQFEKHMPGSSVGPLAAAVIRRQFEALRAADPNWYERPGKLSASELGEVRRTTLSDVIRRNTGIRDVQANAFVSSTRPSIGVKTTFNVTFAA